MFNRRSFLARTAGAVSASAIGMPSLAQVGNKPLRIVCPWPAGGATDVLCRAIGQKLQGTYAQTVVVENKTGASGRLGVEYVKNQDPNSNTMVIISASNFGVHPYVYKKIPYEASDFTPVATVCDIEFCLSVGPMVPADVKTPTDLIRWVSADPGARGKIGIPAMGSVVHFAGFRAAKAMGLDLTYVPYRGGLPVVQDVMGGHLPLGFTQVGEAYAQQETGKLRVIATAGAQRPKVMPNTPTFKEMGFDAVVPEWVGFIMPAKAPAADVMRLNAAIRAAVETAEVRETFEKMNFKPRGKDTPEDMLRMMRADHEQWGPIVKATGFTIEE
ncbi:Bug family tripartite tricarboxylate transporter substrate binding protein [Hydrogenophaga sp. OTU3427]|uniref:Bug family tripartite tricarboxylate transporter substrate binding protein n=1 Tax=Hydrogenophaga sp. OTU3427 TaxID=3043856 RepID=UPI00313AC71E